MSPSVPHSGQESTAQYGSSLLPTSPAFSSTNTVPGSICSGIHSVSTFSSWTMTPPGDISCNLLNQHPCSLCVLLSCVPSTSPYGAVRFLHLSHISLDALYRIAETHRKD